MLNLYLLIFALCCWLGVCVGQIVLPGQCDPNIQLHTEFDRAKFSEGEWHEILRTDDREDTADCSRFNFVDNNGIFNVEYKGVKKNFAENAQGTLTSPQNDPARLTLDLKPVYTDPKDFWIILSHEGHEFYAVAYSCQNIDTSTKSIQLWVLSRETTLTSLLQQALNVGLMDLFGFDSSMLNAVDHSPSACFELPIIQPGQNVIIPGDCDQNLAVKEQFDPVQFSGLWHQIESYQTDNSDGTCVRAEYTLGEGGIVNVLNSQVINETLQTITGTASVISTDGSAKLKVNLNVGPNIVEQDLWILETDYENFAVSYSCQNVENNQRRLYSWILGRKPVLEPVTRAAVDKVIDSYLELNPLYFQETIHSFEGCFFFPEPTDGPVIFRGQCEMVNINAKAPFDAVEYMGFWYNVELYPAPFQGGTCSNALYTLNGGVVDVYNTQVINQTLDTINGVAVPVATDGSAKLLVTFAIPGVPVPVESNYWVLDTDYKSYALVYSCNNIGDDNMQVSSWKLSRTKTLTAEGNDAITQIMNGTKVLDQRFFQTVDQSEEGCFFVPTRQAGVPVVFPGKCDDTIGMPSFNLAQFVGSWYEIQAYPKIEQPGQCIAHEYSSNSNTVLNLTSTSVVDNFLAVTQGQLTASDSSGRLTINIPGPGDEDIVIPFTIVATDYNSYALAYSCVNQDGDRRAVWGWKLSKTTQLTQEAVTAINNAMNNIDVLRNEYFWDIDHSEQTCFQLPVIQPGQPIVIPGKCDQTVKGIAAFDPVKFGGLWYQVQGYFSESSSGTCVRAQYTLNGGVVDVLNSQVIDRKLETITGTASIVSTDGSGHLRVLLNAGPQIVEQDLWILDTDYDNYAVSYSCVDKPNDERQIYAFILSKQRELSAAAQIEVDKVIASRLELNKAYFNEISQSQEACFYFPEPDPTKPVIFRGKCNETIQAQASFQPAEYMNLWHDIRSYPELFQTGTCQNAFYTLVDGKVDVFNTQVIDQKLDTMSGTGVIASTDGSAKLNVTFNVGGQNVTTNYWVLKTDYENYALVYSCREVDDEYYQVTSWQLSRTRELAPAYRAAIDEVVQVIAELDDRYYIDRNQTDADCFYFPEPEPNKPVIFRGQCDNDIPTLTNFDAAEFAGVWHEIGKYPYGPKDACINHRFDLASSTLFNRESFLVRDQSLISINKGSVNNAGDGRLTIDILVDGNVQEVPFWILDTDYKNYAVAYGCRNLDNNYRQIYSWRLSKTRQPDPQIEAAFDVSRLNIDVLQNGYFESIDQTDNACFYLPDLGPNEEVILPGQCDPNIPVITDFDLQEYLGQWRLIETYFDQRQDGDCNRADYSAGASGSMEIVNSVVTNQLLRSVSASAVPAGAPEVGKLNFTLTGSSQASDYWILGTDYKNYALVYSCRNEGNDQRRVFSWKLSRQATLTNEAKAEIDKIVATIDVLNDLYYNKVDQSEAKCFYFPEPDPTKPVMFRGKCNETIQAQASFQPAEYMNLWHDIRSYPELFQMGTCQNAFYTLVDGKVDVFNTQVIDQKLDTMSGTGVIASTDGSAKLNVTFNVGGIDVTTNYWVLKTDYENYALVYSCRQVEEEYYQVTSWQLSRARELAPVYVAAIQEVVDKIPVLDDRYYIDRNQSDADCFYFPEPESNKPVIFRGQCDNDIPTLTNFEAAKFEGTWHEIEKYPYGPNDACVNHRFDFVVSSSTFNQETFHVQDQELISSNKTTINNNDNGRLTIDISVDGTVQRIPFWILDTDYDNYALAYGCRNLDNNYRQIYSWKLSKTRTPSSQVLAALDVTPRNIDVLQNIYFDAIKQTDEACFYLPNLGPNEPVTFPGQCDPNIPVVTDFNPTQYLGPWRLVESYYDERQSGTCNRADYSEGENSVIVVNSQVVNQQLQTITGSAVVASTDGTGKLLVTFPNSETPADYWILGTDYSSYALVYSCRNEGNDRRRVWSWKLGRQTTFTENAKAEMNKIVNNINVLNEMYYQQVDNSDNGCFFYPEPDSNTPVVFPGQCDPNIPVKAAFEPEKYLNTWYDIESYPAPFQTGTCSKANYLANTDGSVLVENTQVMNQRLETWIGTAVVASTDGSAKLNVTFNINGQDVTTNYWVLDTDYSSYAFVYSCENITPETRSVFSWKLSRQPTLTPDAAQVIDKIIDSIPVLSQKYYVARGHSAEDCFYYPENYGGDVILNGQCVEDSQVPAVTGFEPDSFVGTWFEVSRFPSSVQQGQCFSAEYSLGGPNSLISQRSFVVNETQIRSTVEASVPADGRGVLTGDIPNVPFNKVYILGYDSQDFALTYSCTNLEGNKKQIFSWILSRKQDGVTAAASNQIKELVSSNIDLWEGYFEPTGQDNDACFHYPPVDELQGVVDLIGPCPNNIQGVTDFNAGAYLGEWFEMARFPAQDQVGQCSRAEYTLDDSEQVVVYNTEVFEQTLLTQFGFAEVSSTDGTGQLKVDFIVNGVPFTAVYYILATDYESYSLVYSCTNIANDRRRVASWKLSRNRTLSTEAQAAMEPVIKATQGLLEEYYQPTSQSDEDCFYIPNVLIDKAPRFRGQCENIQGVANFDVEKYLGWWHEIERYPVDDAEVGECRSSEYQQDGSTYAVVDKKVLNNEGFVVPGTVVATPEGKLVRTLSNGKTQDIWVLATDYESYALLYACENVNDDSRLVWSAKHSKSRSLTTEAQNAMAPIIANNMVLYPQFYQNVDQREVTCFHYPAIAEGQAVIIPGQCDENIPVQSLNINDFAGTWYQTAKYDAVDSSCIATRFIVDENSGNIEVRHVEVREGETVELEGVATVTEGSGLIEVTLNSEGNTTYTWYILETDYTSYAVAYNCMNINNYRRQIRAWKLSRERSLPIESAVNIEALIDQRQELHEPYFRTISQTENCPEPSSAYLIKSSVIVLLLTAMLRWLL